VGGVAPVRVGTPLCEAKNLAESPPTFFLRVAPPTIVSKTGFAQEQESCHICGMIIAKADLQALETRLERLENSLEDIRSQWQMERVHLVDLKEQASRTISRLAARERRAKAKAEEADEAPAPPAAPKREINPMALQLLGGARGVLSRGLLPGGPVPGRDHPGDREGGNGGSVDAHSWSGRDSNRQDRRVDLHTESASTEAAGPGGAGSSTD